MPLRRSSSSAEGLRKIGKILVEFLGRGISECNEYSMSTGSRNSTMQRASGEAAAISSAARFENRYQMAPSPR